MPVSPSPAENHYHMAIGAIDQALEKFRGCTDEEKSQLRQELAGLRDMHDKLTSGRVEIVVFGEISTGKSALINALVGEAVTSVDVRGGWTRDVWQVNWQGTGYCLPGLGESQVVLVDTPGINEVGGEARGEIAREAAQRAELILFVTDSDLNDTEYRGLVELAAYHKPILVVLNKADLYSRDQRQRLLDVLQNERVATVLPGLRVVAASADPREREYIIQAADGAERTEWRKPAPDVADLKVAILETLEAEGLALLALNAALFAADKTDRIAALRIKLRERRAMQTVWSFATAKAIAVGLNPFVFADVMGGLAVDAGMVGTLARVYGLEMSWQHSRDLAWTILRAAGWMSIGVLVGQLAVGAFKSVTFGKATLLTALPQGAAAGYGSFIVGQAAKYYFEHGASWGAESPKVVVERILAATDKESILQQLRAEIAAKLRWNVHSK